MTRPPLPPDADALLDAISWFLEMRVMPELGDYDRFQARVTLNLLAQLRREVSLSADHEASEMARIDGLLGPGQGDAEARRAASGARHPGRASGLARPGALGPYARQHGGGA